LFIGITWWVHLHERYCPALNGGRGAPSTGTR
jgi:hypothetical protein